MAKKLTAVFITADGVPATGLTPTIDVWELDPSSPTANTKVVTAASMTEIGEGQYRYDYSSYDFTKVYTYLVNAGLGVDVRYHYGGKESYQDEIAYQNYEELAASHLVAGTMGYLMNQISADTSSVKIDMTTVLSILNTLLDHAENRTKIDKIAKTLTVYADDGTTPIKVFDLKNANGDPSVTEIVERVPV